MDSDGSRLVGWQKKNLAGDSIAFIAVGAVLRNTEATQCQMYTRESVREGEGGREGGS